MRRTVPDVVIRRLVTYLRVLQELGESEADRYVSSRELGLRAGVSPAQVRKDLAIFGEFGKQGVGYQVNFLRQELSTILNLNRPVRLVLIGAGELGTALTRYITRRRARDDHYPFELLGAFDNDPARVGTTIEDVPVYPVDALVDWVRDSQVEVAIITVPAPYAQQVADRCVAAGIRGILNFAPTKLFVPPGVRLHHSDVSLELQQLAYYLD
ncbi:MAG: redox-sensing transcriptional repressor Rex [bacterium]|nr:redox-sensing transcriptional repressor Rex [bacterium]